MQTAFERIAIVNRGEAAMRLIHAVREYNRENDAFVHTIALYTDPERNAMFVREADESFSLGSLFSFDDITGERKGRYLDYPALERALRTTQADAVWAGSWVVAEDPEFAALCERLNITFIGPSADLLRVFRNRIQARYLAEKAGLPVAPWSGSVVDTLEDAKQHAKHLGYPLLIKAALGSGAAATKQVRSELELAEVFESARTSALQLYGDASVFLERHVGGSRLIEVQIISDGETCWSLGVRDCTLQRGRRKILEEAPSPCLSAIQTKQISEAAVRLAQIAGYRNIGTVEFLYDRDRRSFYFLNVITRLQVEHPVTEVVTGVDLVKMQLHVARGGKLKGDPPLTTGHAIEARLYAEDPENSFSQGPGLVRLFRMPTGSGIRVDTGIEEGDIISPEFDMMAAKIIALGNTREEAISRLRRALIDSTFITLGGVSNKGFLLELLDRPDVIDSSVDVDWLDRLISEGKHASRRYAEIALLMAGVEEYEAEFAIEKSQFLAAAAQGRPLVEDFGTRSIQLAYRGYPFWLSVSKLSPHLYRFDIEGRRIELRVENLGRYEHRLTCRGRRYRVFSVVQGIKHLIEVNGIPHRIARDQGFAVRSPSPAVVVSVLVQEGDMVEKGDRLAVLEVMKMEISVVASFSGRVREVLVYGNMQVSTGTPLLYIEPVSEPLSTANGNLPKLDVLDLASSDSTVVPHESCARVFENLKHSILGFDVDASLLRSHLTERGIQCEGIAPDDEKLLAWEQQVLTIFADVSALFQREPDDNEFETTRSQSAESFLYNYLRDLDARGAGLPASFVDKMERAISHYGINILARTPELEDCLLRLFRSQLRIGHHITIVTSILQRWLDDVSRLAPNLGAEFRDFLDRLITETQRGYPNINLLAREVRFRYFRQPLIERAKASVYAEAESHLALLQSHPDSEDRPGLIQALVQCPQPLKTVLSSRYETAEPAFRLALLEVMTRRYYRIRELRSPNPLVLDSQSFMRFEYEHEGKSIQVVASHSKYTYLEIAFGRLNKALEAVPEDHDIVVDFYVWKEDGVQDSETIKQELLGILIGVNLNRRLRRIVIAVSGQAMNESAEDTRHFVFRPTEDGYSEDSFIRDVLHRSLHPMMAKRLQLWRIADFEVEQLPSPEDIFLFRAVARENPKDERLIAVGEVRDLTPVRDASRRVVQLPQLERMLTEVIAGIRHFQTRRSSLQRLHWNRILFYIWPPFDLKPDEATELLNKLVPITEGAGLEAIVLHIRQNNAEGKIQERVIRLSSITESSIVARLEEPPLQPLRALGEYEQKVVQLRKRGLLYPYEIIKMLAPPRDGIQGELPPGQFVEYDLDENYQLVPVNRPFGRNKANIIVGLIRNYTTKYPEGMERVILLGDPSYGMGSLAEPECRRIIEAIALARERRIPLEWFAVSAGAKISMESGTENMDWIALVLRRIIEFTQGGGEINIIVTGINVGAQPYWNAEATMLMHTRGILVMTPNASMVLTGKQALDYSGGVSAEDNLGIGGYERIMGPNGQAQYFARDIADACRILLRYYEHTFIIPGERFPRRAITFDPAERDVCTFPHGRVDGHNFATVGEVLSSERNAGRKKPFDIRRIMRAASDQDHEPLERWYAMRDAEIAVVWDAHVGGYAVCLVGLESRPLPRIGQVPADGPIRWTGGTLFPRSSKKVARAINAASNNRPLVVLANLSGFDGSPESMRNLQLEYGAEIGRAVVNFKGPIIFCVVSRYHGGAFVVFSNQLNENMEIIALEGTYASVIGGAPAAAVVFAREVTTRTTKDSRIQKLDEEIAKAEPGEKARLRTRREKIFQEVYSMKLGEVAEEFDKIHSVHRAQKAGSVHSIIEPVRLRPYLIEAIERGMQRELDRIGLETKILA